MKAYSADIPAYVTIRFEARDDAHAREILATQTACFVELGRHDFDLGEGVMLSPAITLYQRIKYDPVSVMWCDDDDARPVETETKGNGND